MAKEALGLHLYSMEEDGDSIPSSSNIAALPSVEGGFYTLIEVRADPDKQLSRSVTKNVTLPRRLEMEASAAQLNYSQVLQHALKQELVIVEKQPK